MTFVKGNKMASVNKGRPKPKTEAWKNIVGWLIGDGGYKFKEKLAALSNAIEISKEEKEFINHYKDLLEFHQPKLSRKELVGKDGGAIEINIEKKEKIKDALNDL